MQVRYSNRVRASALTAALAAVAAWGWPTAAAADDWPQWQGPDRNAMSRERGLLQEWPKEGPPLAWRIKGLGAGPSTPSIAAGRIYGMSNRGNDEVVWAVSEKDGSPIWVTRLGAAFHQEGWGQANEGPGGTPTVDGDRLYVMGMAGDVSCLQVRDGKIVWQRSLQRDFGAKLPTWSFRESPLVDGDKLIVTPGGDGATLAALDKATGKTIWTSPVPGNPQAAYASVIAFDFDGQREYAQLTAKALVGVAASDGRFLWRFDKPANGNGINVSTPIHHEGTVFAASAYGAGGGLVKLSRAAGGVKADEVYFTNKMQNHHGGMIVYDGVLYGANGGNGGGFLVSLDFKTGDVLWNERESGRRAPKGSVAFADGRLYYRTEDGPMLLIEPNAKQYLERGRFEQPERSDKPAWAHPVIANGKLYLRDQDLLLCYDIKAK